MVDRPEAYRWSSCRVHALGEESEWLVPHPLYDALGSTPEQRQIAYRAICCLALSEAELARQRRPRSASQTKESDSEVRLLSQTIKSDLEV